MKKILMCAALTAALIACKKDAAQPEKTSTKHFLRIQEVANDGSTTVSPVIIVTVKD